MPSRGETSHGAPVHPPHAPLPRPALPRRRPPPVVSFAAPYRVQPTTPTEPTARSASRRPVGGAPLSATTPPPRPPSRKPASPYCVQSTMRSTPTTTRSQPRRVTSRPSPQRPPAPSSARFSLLRAIHHEVHDDRAFGTAPQPHARAAAGADPRSGVRTRLLAALSGGGAGRAAWPPRPPARARRRLRCDSRRPGPPWRRRARPG